jgi:hypothetical protein
LFMGHIFHTTPEVR